MPWSGPGPDRDNPTAETGRRTSYGLDVCVVGARGIFKVSLEHKDDEAEGDG